MKIDSTDDMFHFFNGLSVNLLYEKNKNAEEIFSFIQEKSEDWALLKKETRSPIEEKLAVALLFIPFCGGHFRYCATPLDVNKKTKINKVNLYAQAPVGKYTADFLLEINFYGEKRLVAIECDGHQFHERTKEQAAHDKKRDRFFQSQGINILRFTGSEIYRDVFECWMEIFNFTDGIAKEIMGRKDV